MQIQTDDRSIFAGFSANFNNFIKSDHHTPAPPHGTAGAGVRYVCTKIRV